jgi:hypothetical protein
MTLGPDVPFGPRRRERLSLDRDMTDDQDRRLPPEISMSIPSERHARASDLHVRRWTGLLFLPVALATMAGAMAAGHVIGRTGSRALGVSGLLLAAVGMTIPAL